MIWKMQFNFTAPFALYISFLLTAFPPYALAWNIAGHMLSGGIAYQILQHESPSTILAIRAILEKHPWYESRWKAQLDRHAVQKALDE